MVRTHQWENRWSIPGQRLRPGQSLHEGLFEGIEEETGNTTAVNPQVLSTFMQIPGSGYHRPNASLIFTDFVLEVGSKRFRLNDEAQEGLWVPPEVALQELSLEPNAEKTIRENLDRLTA